jgi:hypothetical protein
MALTREIYMFGYFAQCVTILEFASSDYYKSEMRQSRLAGSHTDSNRVLRNEIQQSKR